MPCICSPICIENVVYGIKNAGTIVYESQIVRIIICDTQNSRINVYEIQNALNHCI